VEHPVIWDCFMLRDELDMLECRLIEMQDYDVTHVLVESFVTHRGEPKPLHFAENQERFKPWQDRIEHVVVSRSAYRPEAGPWEREHVQRNMAWLALAPEPDDLVLIADVDEIPSAAVLAADPDPVVTLRQRIFAFAVDWEFPEPELTSVLARASWLRGGSLGAVRDARGRYPVAEDGGWHFSWLGGPAAIERKISAHCHEEQDEALSRGLRDHSLYERGAGIWGFSLIPAEVDDTWPRYVRERRCPASWFRPRREAIS
jgi:Glycosyltransferase family 17